MSSNVARVRSSTSRSAASSSADSRVRAATRATLGGNVPAPRPPAGGSDPPTPRTTIPAGAGEPCPARAVGRDAARAGGTGRTVPAGSARRAGVPGSVARRAGTGVGSEPERRERRNRAMYSVIPVTFGDATP
ncbi:hypothetical protein [Frankia sp. BMG5.11]|uniref:hypothetical protein n=1 Tax=Parafrankia sp. BMG5.11 TaxID=222540 RepID=UPI001404288F